MFENHGKQKQMHVAKFEECVALWAKQDIDNRFQTLLHTELPLRNK